MNFRVLALGELNEKTFFRNVFPSFRRKTGENVSYGNFKLENSSPEMERRRFRPFKMPKFSKDAAFQKNAEREKKYFSLML